MGQEERTAKGFFSPSWYLRDGVGLGHCATPSSSSEQMIAGSRW